MKTFNEIRDTDKSILNERYLRKGAGVLFANKARTHGQKAEAHFKRANSYLENRTTSKNEEENLDRIMLAICELSNGLIEIRKQNGANTSLALTSVLLSEKNR